MNMWAELGIGMTADTAAIRRAYAVRLKRTRPEDDPAAFARLRAAYEAALAWAARQKRDPEPAELPDMDSVGTVPERPADPEPEPEAEPESEPEPEPVVVDAGEVAANAFFAALGRRDVGEAAELLTRALAAGVLPLSMEMRMADELLAALTAVRELAPATLREIARRFGWPGAGGAGARGAALRALDARIAAETWLEGMRASAASTRFWLGDETALGARLMLGKGGRVGLLTRYLPPEPLRQMLAQFDFHKTWIAGQFDPARIEALRALPQPAPPGRAVRVAWIGLNIVAWIGLADALGLLISPVASGLFSISVLVRGGLRLFGIGRGVAITRRRLFGLLIVCIAGCAATAVRFDRLGHPGGGARPDLSEPGIAGGMAVMATVGALIAWSRLALPRPLGLAGWFKRSRIRLVLAGFLALVAVFAVIGALLGEPDVDKTALPAPSPTQGSPEWRQSLRDGAAAGDRLAALQLGTYLMHLDPGDPASDREAASLLRQAQPEYAEASQDLGVLYETGRGVARDLAAARLNYLAAGGPTDPAIAVHVARMLIDGVGGPKDPASGFALLRRAAARNDADAIAGVGRCYLDGTGTPRDRARGVRWLTAAAESGQVGAMTLLADLSASDRPPDLVTAYRWLGLAERLTRPEDATGAEIRRGRAGLAAKLDARRRKAVDDALPLWRPSPPSAPG